MAAFKNDNYGNLAKLKHFRILTLKTIEELEDLIQTRKKYNMPTKSQENDLVDCRADLKRLEKEILKRETKEKLTPSQKQQRLYGEEV
jgi:hypothetical protein